MYIFQQSAVGAGAFKPPYEDLKLPDRRGRRPCRARSRTAFPIQRCLITTTPPFALSRILGASGSASMVALPASGVVRPLQLSACLEFDPPHEFFSKLDQQLSRRRNHRGQRSQAALRRRRCRFDESHAVCHIDAGETSRADETLEDHADARSPNGVSRVAPAQAVAVAAAVAGVAFCCLFYRGGFRTH